jgi:hypothetical protein
MQDRPLYDRAMFWLGFGGPVGAIGGIVLGVGVAQVVTKPNGSVWDNAWFDAGLAVVAIGAVLLDWALVLYLAHRHIEAHVPVVAKPEQAVRTVPDNLPVKPTPARPTMIARPPGMLVHPQSEIDIKLLHHQWLMIAGKQVLSVGVRIHNSNGQLAREIERHHWLFGSHGRAVSGNELVVTVKGRSSRTVGIIEPLETIEGTISCEIVSAQPQPRFDLYIGDDLGLEAVADR